MFFFFNDTATTEIYTLSLHDALPICRRRTGLAGYPGDGRGGSRGRRWQPEAECGAGRVVVNVYVGGDCVDDLQSPDRKSTRLNSSHANISYAVFCLKKQTNPRLSSFS